MKQIKTIFLEGESPTLSITEGALMALQKKVLLFCEFTGRRPATSQRISLLFLNTRFFFYHKKNFYKKMSLKNPKTFGKS